MKRFTLRTWPENGQQKINVSFHFDDGGDTSACSGVVFKQEDAPPIINTILGLLNRYAEDELRRFPPSIQHAVTKA